MLTAPASTLSIVVSVFPPDDQPFVMDRFYRADKARSRELDGYGLCLSITKRLVERYHGSITISSMPNEGTQVTIVFPIIAERQN